MATGFSSISENGSKIHSSSEFQQRSQPLSTILQTTVLPVIVKYDSSNLPDERLVASAFDPKEPLLIHSRYKIRRIRGRCVKFEPESKTLVDCDSDVVIPEFYPGWFAVFGNPSTQTRDPIVPHYRRVSQLAISACTRFLVAGDRPISALLAKQGEGDLIDFHPTDIHPGTVLLKGKLFSYAHPTKGKKWFGKKVKKEAPEDKYMCTHDGHGHTFFIRCEMEGLFYVLEMETAHLPIPVLKLQDIIQRYTFPVLIRLVQGQIPSPPSSSFNGTLVLFESQLALFAVAFSLKLHKEMIFEILDDSSLPFVLSAPSETEYEEYRKALIFHEGRVDTSLCNIRFQNRNSECIYIKDPVENGDSMRLTGENRGKREPDILSCVRIKELRLFPPSPVTARVVGEVNVPRSVLSLNSKEIRRNGTFDRPKEILFDTIPIEVVGGFKTRTAASSKAEERYGSDTNSSTPRANSESENYTLSSTSQPSLQDLMISESENKEEDLPPPPTEFLQSESVEDEDVPEEVPDESQKYYGLWTAETLDKGSKLSAEIDESDGITLRNKTDDKGKDDYVCRRIPALNVYEDENGYVIPSELTVQHNDGKDRRPASYVSIHPLENDYDTLLNITSDEARGQARARERIISSGSHLYASLQAELPKEVDEGNPKYVNIPLPGAVASGAGCYVNSSHFQRIIEDQTLSPTQNGQFEITQELVSRRRKEQTSESSTNKYNGYMNLREITPKAVDATSHKDRLLDKWKQRGLKKTTQEALVALNEDDFDSLVQADEPLDRLKELLPQISRTDVFKIGLCIKDM